MGMKTRGPLPFVRPGWPGSSSVLFPRSWSWQPIPGAAELCLITGADHSI